MKTIKKVGPLSVAKLSGVMYAIFGCISGLFVLAVLLLDDRDPGMEVFPLGFFAPITLPVMYGVMGFISGLVSAWIYNHVVPYVGGIKIEFTDTEPTNKE